MVIPSEDEQRTVCVRVSAGGTMCSVEHLREFIQQRLTAAAEEIFTQFEKTIVQYEEEMDRQRRLLDISWKPQIKLHRTVGDDSQKHDVQEEEVQTGLQLCDQEELSSSHEAVQLGLMEETKTFMVTALYEEADHSQPEPISEQLLPHNSKAVHPKPGERSEDLNNPVQCEEEMEHQHRLLDVTRKLEIKLYRIALPQQHDLQEQEVLREQRLCCQEEPEPPQIKKEQEEPCSVQGRGQLGVKEEPDIFMETATYEERDHKEPEPNSEQLHSHSSDAFIIVHLEPNQTLEVINDPIKYEEEMDHQQRVLNFTQTLKITLHRTDLQPQHDIKEEMVLADQQFCCQERNTGVDQEEPEPPQVKEEWGDLCSSQEAEQLGLKEETDTFMVTGAYQESDLSDPEPNRDQLLSHSSRESESHNQGASKCEDSGSSRIVECSNGVINLPNSESHCSTDSSKKPVHCDVRGKDFQNKFKIKERQRIHGRKRYPCKTCGKRFSRCDRLFDHMRTHTGEKPYSCETCGKCFRCRDYLSVHMRTHTGERPYPCNTCEKSFTDLSALKKHLKTHTGEKPYHCESCGKRFSQCNNLSRHLRSHTGEKPYSCETCGKCFSQNSELIRHMRTHTGDKPYSCETCGKRFSRCNHLSRHRRTHTGEKPYSCETCGKRFSQSIQLCRHMRTHTGERPYPCNTCEKSFTDSSSLKRHIKTHAREKRYNCETCGKCFSQSTNLCCHMKTHTSEEL